MKCVCHTSDFLYESLNDITDGELFSKKFQIVEIPRKFLRHWKNLIILYVLDISFEVLFKERDLN